MQKIAKITRKRTKIMKNGFFYNFLLHILIFVSIFIFSLIRFIAYMPKLVVFLKNMPCRSKKDQKINKSWPKKGKYINKNDYYRIWKKLVFTFFSILNVY